jgi:hypothetical protein
MKKSVKFEEWYRSSFICTLSPCSQLMISDNKTIEGKSLRILEVCKMILDDPKKDTETIRKEVAMRFFITMRGALDYVNYAKLILVKWNQKP